jgi:hypothetical protein
MADPKQRQHYWMITSLVTFERDAEVQQSHMNGIVETPFKSVSQTVLETVTDSMLHRLGQETEGNFKIKGHTFLAKSPDQSLINRFLGFQSLRNRSSKPNL